jgi:hypothetical protein
MRSSHVTDGLDHDAPHGCALAILPDNLAGYFNLCTIYEAVSDGADRAERPAQIIRSHPI